MHEVHELISLSVAATQLGLSATLLSFIIKLDIV